MNHPTRQSDSEMRIRRSVARLLSLADRLERSCFQVFLIRIFLLWLLRPVELRIRNKVFGMAEDFGLVELPAVFNVFEASDSGFLPLNSTEEALDLALRLRALAGLMVWIYGLDLSTCQTSDDFFWAHYWRHMRCLTAGLQQRALARLNARRTGRATSRRLEVRQGGRSGLPVGSPDLPRQEACRRALHFAA